ncbi:hypothetical protein CWI37_1086p0020 [Hamiltosporidium tvaerminnensis]|uniref:Uncharacterized protein n=1 Tax=Hamiltosporidium tvaerminnensis TaxID=1176355 RepID=A0A4Q9KZS8_9MICR|nr:hypothetical protein CWI37_1086p0020 [Hamiltosporidium tvaerminnensis]
MEKEENYKFERDKSFEYLLEAARIEYIKMWEDQLYQNIDIYPQILKETTSNEMDLSYYDSDMFEEPGYFYDSIYSSDYYTEENNLNYKKCRRYESLEKREERLRKNRERVRIRRANETPEERAIRLEKCRERIRRLRFFRKINKKNDL